MEEKREKKTLEQKIDELKEEIEGYEKEYAETKNETRKDKLLDAITTSGNNLTPLLQQQTLLLQQQQLQPQGNLFSILFLLLFSIKFNISFN